MIWNKYFLKFIPLFVSLILSQRHLPIHMLQERASLIELKGRPRNIPRKNLPFVFRQRAPVSIGKLLQKFSMGLKIQVQASVDNRVSGGYYFDDRVYGHGKLCGSLFKMYRINFLAQ